MGRVLLLLSFLLLATGCSTEPAPGHWRLFGQHARIPCGDCHGDPPGPEPTECGACHAPIRPQPHFAGLCGECHSTEGWSRSFDHGRWKLRDGHDRPCLDCHDGDGNVFEEQTTICRFCHADDAPEWGHFEGDCGACHTTIAFDVPGFEHPDDVSPNHPGATTCFVCHVDPNGFTDVSCVGCHGHNPSDSASAHEGVADYEWETRACIECHPRARAD